MSAGVWILVLTIWGGTSQSGRAITAIEFSGMSTCLAAGRHWMDRQPKSPDNSVSAICVPKG